MTILITLFVWLVVACAVLYIARLVISGFGVPQPFANVFYALVALILLVGFQVLHPWTGPTHPISLRALASIRKRPANCAHHGKARLTQIVV